MKVIILGSSCGVVGSRQYVSTYLINDVVAIDAGYLGFYGSPEEQERIRHVFLTHPHSDHTASLPIFLENVWTPSPECPTVYGSAETLASIQQFIFNDSVWPDFIALSKRMPPFLRVQTLDAEVPVEAEGMIVTPVCVDHTLPTYAYVVQDGASAVIFGADTGPTTRIWEVAKHVPGLQAILLEVSFPNRMKAVAEASCHLTPEMFGREAAKAPPGVRIIAIHLKLRYHDEIVRELSELRLPQVEVGQCERDYIFEIGGSVGR